MIRLKPPTLAIIREGKNTNNDIHIYDVKNNRIATLLYDKQRDINKYTLIIYLKLKEIDYPNPIRVIDVMGGYKVVQMLCWQAIVS